MECDTSPWNVIQRDENSIFGVDFASQTKPVLWTVYQDHIEFKTEQAKNTEHKKTTNFNLLQNISRPITKSSKVELYGKFDS